MKEKPAPALGQDENDDQVKFKPFMGIRPGIYLSAIYLLVILFLIFVFLIHPGLKNPQAALIVKTVPQGAAVRVNDVYMGVSGSKIIIPAGTSVIEAVMPGFDSQSAVRDIRGRVFGSLFFPRVFRIEFHLKTADPAAAFAQYAADFASWSFGGEPTEAWHIPLSLSEGAYRTGTAFLDDAMSNEQKQELDQLLLAASRFTVTRAALRDLIRAKMLLDNSGLSPAPASIAGSISGILHFLSENPGSATWLSRLLPGSAASFITSSSWAKNEYDAETDFLPRDRMSQDGTSQDGASRPANINIAGINFTGMGAGKLLNRGAASTFRPFGNSAEINGFMISENPVPRSLFETFLNESPQWKDHQTDYLQEEISNSPFEPYRNEVITGATWYAADAFCKWLTGRLPSSLNGMEVRLPTENELEYAALSVRSLQNAGWEWCDNPYSPLSFIKASEKAMQTIGSPERSIRGRQSITSAAETKGFPAELSSPFITFRPVITSQR